MSKTIHVGLGFDMIDASTPTLPNAKRGDCSEVLVKETSEQLAAGLVWMPCSFCGRRVLVDCKRATRERCKCGAIRCHHLGEEGWRKGKNEWWFT